MKAGGRLTTTEQIDKIHEEDLQRLKQLRLMDDDFMTKCFEDDPKYIQLVLRIVMEKPDLVVEDVRVQVFMKNLLNAYTGPRAPSARSISPTLPERSPTIPRAVLEERPCQPRRRAEPGISHRSRGWGCRWQSKQSPVIECDSGKSVIPPAWHRRFPRIPVPLHAGSSNPIQGHRGNRRD